MRYFKFFVPLFILLVLTSPSLAIDENEIKQKIVKNIEKIVSEAKIKEPTLNVSTRSPAGPQLYRQVANAVVYIVTADGVQGSGAVLSKNGLIITNWHVVGNEPLVGVLLKPVTPSEKISISKKDIFLQKFSKLILFVT
jgi:S1-C subfamily serine protease